MKVLFVHAHFDDFEFTAAGTFARWRREVPGVELQVLVCTDGAAGHHRMDRETTAARRWSEQQESARLGGYLARRLLGPNGQPFREARLHASVDFLPELWREIRSFEPDYLICPPLPSDPRAGVHVDHLDVAHGVRSVAYLINVPHAFTPEYPDLPVGAAVPVRTPVILTTYDGYFSGGHAHDLAVDVEAVADHMAELAWCHASQLREWLPWVDRHAIVDCPDLEGWRRQYREILTRRRRVLGIAGEGGLEFFQVTAWGRFPVLEELLRDIPGVDREASRLADLDQRLKGWRAAGGE